MIKRLEITHRRDTGFKITLLSDNRQVKSIEIRRENALRVVDIVREIRKNPKNFV